MSLVSEVTAKVRNLVPDSSGRWTDATISTQIHLADCLIREEAGTLWASVDITLQDDALYYTLPESVIAVGSVEFSLDGTTFDDGVLEPTTYRDLDALSRTWRDDRGTQPYHYLLLSAPGVKNTSRIMIWRPISSVTGEKVRVHCLRCYPEDNASFAAATVPEFVQDEAYVPLVMAQLFAPIDQSIFSHYWQNYLDGITRVKTRYGSRYGEGIGGFRAGGPALGERYIG